MDGVERHGITRIRRETRRRTAVVIACEQLAPQMRRIRFASSDFHDFASASPDDHVKLFVPDAAGQIVARDYTPRAFDAAAGQLTIDFALHEAGPATRWALAARPGDRLEIGGPRGSNVVTDDFDWYLLIGDETAIPAIARRLEELRVAVPIIALIAVDGPANHLTLPDRAGLKMIWSDRAGPVAADAARLEAVLADLALPPGDGYIWIAAEGAVARHLKSYIVDQRGHPRAWTKAAGYWIAGAPGAHDTIRD